MHIWKSTVETEREDSFHKHGIWNNKLWTAPWAWCMVSDGHGPTAQMIGLLAFGKLLVCGIGILTLHEQDAANLGQPIWRLETAFLALCNKQNYSGRCDLLEQITWHETFWFKVTIREKMKDVLEGRNRKMEIKWMINYWQNYMRNTYFIL